ncbi:hypothetical protein CAG69_08915 [Vibrio sp. V43_P6S15P86]|uniref:hypothetical protein n=1 Tax=Vibrio sp. V43_P6S15P86 TaxID=1938694 RepID=UPI001372523B|nr:hypothetical protein [Vibrio sp. V43_P6S15P86]NAW82157.1 hypothetical protein [Vibrio sp. V43_P6S15P86]
MKLMLACITVLYLLASPFSWACSYDGQFSNPFAESYPGSLSVAIATQEALDSKSIVLPSQLDGGKGLRRVSWWLQLFTSRHSGSLKGLNIYLIDSQLWSKLDNEGKLIIHTNAPSDRQKVLLLTETTLHNLVSEKLTLHEAKYLGLVTVDEGSLPTTTK